MDPEFLPPGGKVLYVTHLFCASLGGEEVGQPSDVGNGVDDVTRLTAHDGCQLLEGRGELNLH